MRTRHCAVTAHTRKLPDRPHVDDALHRQIAGENAFMARHSLTVDDLVLNAGLCDELEQALADTIERDPSFPDHMGLTP